MKLYEIVQEKQNFDELFLSQIDDETGEVVNGKELDELEQGLKEALINKSSNIVKAYKNLEAYVKEPMEEIERLQAIVEKRKKEAQKFLAYVQKNMFDLGIKKIDTPLGKIQITESISTEYEQDKLPEKFIHIEQKPVVKVYKKEIKEALENGEEVSGAWLQKNYSIKIK